MDYSTIVKLADLMSRDAEFRLQAAQIAPVLWDIPVADLQEIAMMTPDELKGIASRAMEDSASG